MTTYFHSCSKCSEKFLFKSALQEHILDRHTNTNIQTGRPRLREGQQEELFTHRVDVSRSPSTASAAAYTPNITPTQYTLPEWYIRAWESL